MWNDKGMTKVIKTGGGRRAPVISETAERQKGDWPSKDKYWGVYFYHIFAEGGSVNSTIRVNAL